MLGWKHDVGSCDGYGKIERKTWDREMARLWRILGTILIFRRKKLSGKCSAHLKGSTLSLAYAQVTRPHFWFLIIVTEEKFSHRHTPIESNHSRFGLLTLFLTHFVFLTAGIYQWNLHFTKEACFSLSQASPKPDSDSPPKWTSILLPRWYFPPLPWGMVSSQSMLKSG